MTHLSCIHSVNQTQGLLAFDLLLASQCWVVSLYQPLQQQTQKVSLAIHSLTSTMEQQQQQEKRGQALVHVDLHHRPFHAMHGLCCWRQ